MTALYDFGRQAFLDGAINWSADTIQAVFIHVASYTVNLATDQFLSSVPGGARIGTPQVLAGKTSTAGVADANDLLFPAFTGLSIEAMLIYKSTGVDATSRLIAYIDTGVGFGITPNNVIIPVVWSNSATRIFKL